ncbi:MAG TPA: hypothetical protein VFE27_16665 [Acidobacteriaceae bacterium]|nr:hypothetical protein [Acidobacteriaceae bacterium]
MSRRILLAAVLVVAVLVLGVWIFSAHHRKPITDLGITMPLNEAGGGPVSAEAYEVYSALYQAPMHEPLAFSAESFTDIPQVNGNCLRPATPREQEMTAAFVAANRQNHRWEQKFSIPQGYRLLPRNKVAQAQICLATHDRESAACEDYKQLRYVRLLGVPGFDHAHTRALVSVIKSCGRLCGSGGIFAVEKTGGTWQRSQLTDFTQDCSWIY